MDTAALNFKPENNYLIGSINIDIILFNKPYNWIKKFIGYVGLLVFSPLFLILFFCSLIILNILSKKLLSIKNEFIQYINEVSFNKLIKIESHINKFFVFYKKDKDTLTNTNIFFLKNYMDCLDRINTIYLEFSISIKKRLCIKWEDCFDSIEDYNEYCKEMSVFADIWDYETPIEDKEFVFNLNNKN